MTGGSTTTWSEFDRYRQVGAVARTLLVARGRDAVGRRPRRLPDREGLRHLHGDKRAELRRARRGGGEAPAARDASTLKDPKDWKLIGKPTRRLDTPEKITGRAQFGMDVQLPGMLTAVVAHPPVFGGKVKRFDATAAKAVPGVRAVFEVPTGVAVVADDHFWAAKRGRDALDGRVGPRARTPASTRAKLRASYREQAKTPGAEAAAAGDVASRRSPRRRTRSSPSTPCRTSRTRRWSRSTAPSASTADGCEVWTGTQFQTVDQAAGGGDHRPQARAGDDPHDVPRRRLRPAGEPRLGLRRRGRARRRRRSTGR